ncbi:MAG: CoA transferase [Chloroflexi bacterium]|nr:CoA transferase [Chloroflexota bacterium]
MQDNGSGGPQAGALDGIRVLELGGDKGEYGTKILADLGADVIKIEPPSGDPGRRIPPFAGDIPHPERSLRFLYRNVNKRGITLDIESPDGQGILKRLIQSADIVLESYPPGYLDRLGLGYAALQESAPRVIWASVTDFGEDGPYRDYKGSDIVNFAMSGAMYAGGMPESAPCVMPGSPAADAASTYAGVAIMMAFWSRNTTGEGQHIEVSIQEAGLAALYPWSITGYSYAPVSPTAVPLNPRGSMGNAPGYATSDGYVRLATNVPRHWESLVAMLGSPEVLLLPEWQDPNYRRTNADALQAIVGAETQKFPKEQLFREAQRNGIPSTPVNTLAEWANDENTQARGFFVPVEHPVAGRGDYPGPPYQMTETPIEIRRAARGLWRRVGADRRRTGRAASRGRHLNRAAVQ